MQNYFPLTNLHGIFTIRRSSLTRYAFARARLWPALLIFVLARPVWSQEFVPEQVVFPITDFKPDIRHLSPFSIKFGTGFCLDPNCRFVGTNYHVAKAMGKYVRIQGVLSANRYLGSDANDVGAREVRLAWGGSMKFTPAHDLAIYEMRRGLKKFHGIDFDTDDLENSPEVDIYAYPFNWNPKRSLTRWHGKFIGKSPDGLLAFSYEEGRVRAGASGGIVVDSKTKKIVGILQGMVESNDRIAMAVPVKELSNFVSQAQPYLQAKLFPKTIFVSPLAADLYAPPVWPHSASFSRRGEDSPQVNHLRMRAQDLAESMSNFVATETFAWGRDNREPEAADAYETLIADGQQRWRRAGDKKFYDYVPFPPLDNSVVPGTEWSYLPWMVGTKLKLKLRQAPDAVVGGRTIHVFQYSANVEDQVCPFRSTVMYGFFRRTTTRFYDCHGEVWIDESGTILRISQSLDLTGPWHRFWTVVTYGWLQKDGVQHLVPITIATQAEHKKTYWCRGLFTDYEMFGVKTQLIAAE